MFTPRHERALLVATTYIIGFTAAFLLYAEPELPVDLFPENNAAAVVTAQPSEVVEVVPPVSSALAVEYYDGVLTVNASGKTLYKSSSADLLEPGAVVSDQNYFYGAPLFTIAPDQSSVFVCEFQTPDATSCKGQIITTTGAVEHITVSGNPVNITRASADAALFTAVGFKVSTYDSIDPSTPWALE